MADWREPRSNYTAGSQVTPSIFNVLAENEKYLNEKKIELEQVQEAVVQSVVASVRANLADSEVIADAFGKVRKWFSDLRTLAFKSLIGTADIEDKSITSDKVGDGQIDTNHIAANAVTGAKISSGAVVERHLGSGAVTDAKIKSVSASKVTGLAKVATSGNYNDLSNKPSIPSGVTVINNLNSTSTTAALSAYQGKLLNDRLSNLGFKTGNITDSAGNVVGTVKRQGSLVIGEITGRPALRDRPTYYIPSGFRPKKREYAFILTYIGAQIWGVIETNGNLGFGDSTGLDHAIANYGSGAPTTFGYEAA